MPFTFDSPEPELLSQVAAGLNELLSLEGLSLDPRNQSEAYWTPVYTMSGMDILLNTPPQDPVGWRFMIAKPNLGSAVAGDFAIPAKTDRAKYGTAVPATTGIYDGPAVDRALDALLYDWVDQPDAYHVRLLRISGPSVQALWLVPRSSSAKTGGPKIVPYRTLAQGIEKRAYDESEFFGLLKPLAKRKLQSRDL